MQRTWRLWRAAPALALLGALLLAGALGACAAQAPGAQTATAQPEQIATQTPTAEPASKLTPPPDTQEATPTTMVIAGTPGAYGPTCQPSQLTLTLGHGGAAAGHIGVMAHFTNTSNTACSLYGFPGAQMLDAQRKPMTTHALWQTSAYMYTNQPVQRVRLAPGASGYFAVTWSDVTVGSGTSCPTSSYLSVTPPNDFSVITVAAGINACDSNLVISPVEPTAFMGG